MINAGALVVTDRLLSATGDAAGAVREFLRSESGNSKLDTDRVVARSEAEQGHRNAGLAHFIASYGNLQNPVDWVLDHYYAHCAIEASCRDLALAGLFLSKHGLRVDGRRLLGRTDAKRMNAVMLTCGTYDAAGEFAYRVGCRPRAGRKGVLAVIPRHGTLCASGPRLDAAATRWPRSPPWTSSPRPAACRCSNPAAPPLPAPGATAVISVPATDVETHVCAPHAAGDLPERAAAAALGLGRCSSARPR